MSYTFSTLNDKEFELLVRDIINSRFSLDLQSFRSGRDKGIDLRYSTPRNKNEIVVQAKHYLKSGFKLLYRTLIKDELPKVRKLKPERYILATSVELTPDNKDAIAQKFAPFITSANDILGAEDLNKYLRNLPELETKWYKLWLSSLNVLNIILHNAVLGKSAFIAETIKKNIQLYVHGQGYDDAFKILAKHKYILITGQPGVGKTTLANLLTYHLLAKGYELVFIDADIKSAEDVLSRSPQKKQLFFFDDFLGSNYLEIHNPKTTETEFVNFVNRIKGSKNKYLILTTRTTIYTNAVDRYEKLRRVKVDIARKEIILGQYTDLDKAKILYNHLYHSGISSAHLKEVFTDKNYWKIIQHKNYNPRLIEFISDTNNIENVKKGEYMGFVLTQFKNPQEVWMHAYEQQFTMAEKLLLHAVFSHGTMVDVTYTKLIFDAFLQYQIKHHNYHPVTNPFKNACKSLLDGILIKEVFTYLGRDTLSFINPSINDFLTNYFVNNVEELQHLFKSSIFIEQLERYGQYFFNYSSPLLGKKEKAAFVRLVIEAQPDLRTFIEFQDQIESAQYVKLRAAAFLDGLYYETKPKILVDFTRSAIEEFPIKNIDNVTKQYYVDIIREPSLDLKLVAYVSGNWRSIITRLLKLSNDENDFEEIMDLFSEHNEDYNIFITGNYELVRSAIAEMVDGQTKEWIEDEETSICTPEDIEILKEKVERKRSKMFNKFGVDDRFYDEDDFFDMKELERTMRENNRPRKEIAPLVNTQKSTRQQNGEEKERKEIDALFTL